MTLPVSGTGASPRVISQPGHGSVGLSGQIATYFPEAGFVGTDSFTYAAWDGSKNSGLGTGTIVVDQGPYSITTAAHVPSSYPAGWPAPFANVATPSNITATVTYDWDFGDGAEHSPAPYAIHTYASPGTFHWTVSATVQAPGAAPAAATSTGEIVIGSPVLLSSTFNGDQVTLRWPNTIADTLLEQSIVVGSAAIWSVAPDAVVVSADALSVTRTNLVGTGFFRIRRPW
jgi:PKD repeat protein